MDILILEGDGIGPEIMSATMRVLETIDKTFALDLKFRRLSIGLSSLRACGTTFPSQTLQTARDANGTILGPVSHNDYPPPAEGGINPSGALRKGLDLYANIRPARTRRGFPPSCCKSVDLIIVRENTEGFYSDRSMFVGPANSCRHPTSRYLCVR